MHLINVRYKTEAIHEYSQFLFSIVGHDLRKGGYKFKGKFMFRVCVPVIKTKHAYVDFKCPYSQCTAYGMILK